jgi:hypothetical protein
MVVLQFPGETARRRAELGAFARYCVHRIEDELGSNDRWIVTLAPTREDGYASKVEVHAASGVVSVVASERDSALAIWDAMCQIARALRAQ